MKAVRYEAATQFRIVEVDKPVPEPGEVVIKVAQTGLCGTDLRHGRLQRAMPGLGDFPGQPNGEHRLAHAGRPNQQDAGGGVQIPVPGQVPDQVGVDAGLRVVVKIFQPGGGGQIREPEPPGQPPRLGGLHLDPQ